MQFLHPRFLPSSWRRPERLAWGAALLACLLFWAVLAALVLLLLLR